MTAQWDCLLKNAGTWVGSFTRLSPMGEIWADTPSTVILQPSADQKLMRQEIHKRPADGPPQDTVLEYRTLNRSVLFFENGAFSQGSIQWGPFSEFGAELGLIAEHHRLRLVQLFDKTQQLGSLTLIREHLEGTEPSARSPLTIEDLLGTWQGEAVTLYPDWSPSETMTTQLTVARSGDTLTQTLSMGVGQPTIASSGTIQGDRILFETGPQAVQVLLLPDGASSTCPTHIQPRQPLFLEVGWLLAPNLRQRMIRRYNDQGGWASLTLVTEHRT
ncbi:MAG: DUF3598 family protein [Leptolyngbyaceae cyanobacterium T60_A2020_046]|nr:DUF3598 family protein [Leptolyngbyaceae cyanobacterium T60_A2020_046]